MLAPRRAQAEHWAGSEGEMFTHPPPFLQPILQTSGAHWTHLGSGTRSGITLGASVVDWTLRVVGKIGESENH